MVSKAYILQFLDSAYEKIMSKIECVAKTLVVVKLNPEEIEGFDDLLGITSDLVLKLKLFNTHFSNVSMDINCAGITG